MSSTKLIIFDLDNTLIATQAAAKIGYKQAIYYIAKQHGIYDLKDKLYNHWKRLVQTLSHEIDPYKRRFNYSLSLLLKEHKIPDTFLPEALKIYERELLSHLKLFPGVKDLIKTLKQNKHLIAVTTGSDRGEAQKKLRQVGLLTQIDCLVTANEVGQMKPSSQYYQNCIAEFKLNKSSVLVIGDSEHEDLEPAKALGLTTYLVSPHLKQLNRILDDLATWF